MRDPIRVGVIGCGNISSTYFKACKKFESLTVVACADVDMARAEAKAAEFGVPRACSVADLLADPAIGIVINLTIPRAHAEIALMTITAGKAVYNEKPLAINRDDGRRIVDAAAKQGVLVGCAPDTFLGAGLQTCRNALDAGLIGEPIAAAAYMTNHGHEHWHPDPDFYYQPGGGPMLDMGPYYLTALVTMLGPVERVTGSTHISFPERTITSQPKHGSTITVRVPTHVTGILDFASGAIGTITTSFDTWAAELPRIEIYGTRGTLSAPDPNGFGGPVRIWQEETRAWQELPLSLPYVDNWRGIGVADMAVAMQTGRPHRANGEIAFHVLDIMEAIDDASREGRHLTLSSTCHRPAPIPPGLREGTLDE